MMLGKMHRGRGKPVGPAAPSGDGVALPHTGDR